MLRLVRNSFSEGALLIGIWFLLHSERTGEFSSHSPGNQAGFKNRALLITTGNIALSHP